MASFIVYTLLTPSLACPGNLIRQAAEGDAQARHLLLAHEFVSSKDDGGFLFALGLLGDAFGAVAVEGGVGAAQKGKVRLVDQVEQPVVRFVEKAVLAPCFADFVRCLAGGGVDEVAGQGCRSPAGFRR